MQRSYKKRSSIKETNIVPWPIKTKNRNIFICPTGSLNMQFSTGCQPKIQAINNPSLTELLRKTIDTYDNTAAEYAQKNSTMRFWEHQQSEFTDYLNGKKILDAGCGHGRDTKDFIAQGYSVTGIDLSEGLLGEAQKRVPNGKFLKMDFTNLTFPDKSFDGLWCAAALLHIEKSHAENALSGFARVLKDEGVLFVSIKKGEGEVVKTEPQGQKFFANYTKSEIDKLVEKNFVILKSYERGDQYGQGWICVFARPKR